MPSTTEKIQEASFFALDSDDSHPATIASLTRRHHHHHHPPSSPPSPHYSRRPIPAPHPPPPLPRARHALPPAPLSPSRSRKTLPGHRSAACRKDRVEAHHRPGFEAAPRAEPRWRENLAERLADAPEEKEDYLAQLRSLRVLQRKLEHWRLATHVEMRSWKKWNRKLLRDKRVVRSLERGERLHSGMKPWEMSRVWKESGLRLETKAADESGDGNGNGDFQLSDL
ncbi:hypothetical protein LZ554_000421 [Drepanopeziza brunnea f. sp. 'monogermtubi']|nr:hypothetical protein LZ554_000421 [Drepanopeziza brunnea f. sp. 'monogermtubi']